jgi:KID repeat family protein|nr:MAG TPA: tail protein [Caudoviricetes sp.]
MLLNFLKTRDKILDKDCKITYEYDGLITLEFEIGEDEEVYCEEPFFISGENQFIIKSIDEEVVTCTLDFTSLKKDFYVGQKSFDSLTLNDILHQLLDPVGWEIKNAQSVKIRRTLTVEDESLLSAIFKLEELYNCTFEFDCKNKVLKVIDEGADRDYIVSKDINLEKFIIKKDTYEHYTRIYGFGSEGMTFSSINNGKEYVENFNYNKNIIPAVFRDDRFTDKLNLKKHCEELLEKHSKPLIEYELSIIELERRDLRLHDIITFLNYKTKKKEKHRIIEITKYSDDETKNEIKFINRTENLSEYLQNRQEQISQEVKKEIGRYDFSSRFDESIKKATSKFEKLLLNGYKIETENGTYYVDQLPKEKAKNVLRIGLGGIMGSSTGWNGTYSLAISNDGIINADRILTGFLDGDRIKANSITSDRLTVKAKEEITEGLVKKENFNEFLVNNQVLKSEINESVTSEVSKVKVGARNLLQNSYFFDKSKWHTFGAKSIEYDKLNDIEDWGDCESIKLVERNTDVNSNILAFYLFDNLKLQNKDYVFSFDCKNLSDFDLKFFLNEYTAEFKEVVKSKEQKRVVLKAKDVKKLFIEVLENNQEPVFSIKKLKIEEGTIATTWVPALEDTEKENEKLKQEILNLTTTNSELAKQLNNLELNNLQLKEFIKSSIKQTHDSITFDFDKFKEIYQNDKSVFQGKFDDISSYIRFDIEGMEMGKKDGEFKMRLSPKKQSFFLKEAEVAYFSNEELYITNARILRSIRIGNFAFVPRENGNLSFRKVVE